MKDINKAFALLRPHLVSKKTRYDLEQCHMFIDSLDVYLVSQADSPFEALAIAIEVTKGTLRRDANHFINSIKKHGNNHNAYKDQQKDVYTFAHKYPYDYYFKMFMLQFLKCLHTGHVDREFCEQITNQYDSLFQRCRSYYRKSIA